MLWFGVVALVAAGSRWRAQADRGARCALDGNRIEPVYRVDLVRRGVVLHSFCSLTCARQWPDVAPDAYWQVRDEASGRPLDAGRAHFVESGVESVPARHERTHVFADWAEAQHHLARYGGRFVADPLGPGGAR